MANPNYFNGVVKILEAPKEIILKSKNSFVCCKVQIPQRRTSRVINLEAWGKLAKNTIKNYKISDYLIVEGYVSNRTPLNKNQSKKKTQISAIKIYPYVLKTVN